MSLKSFLIFHRPLPIVGALCALVHVTPALAQEAFAGVYAHAVNTPLSIDTGEGGADLQLGYRFAPSKTLRFLGKPAPYLIASVNTDGDTNFAGVGLSWKLGSDRLYARPEVGLVIHDGPARRIRPSGQHTELGSRVLFEPGLSVGLRVSPRLAVEASWIHISQARLFNFRQNPGIDMWGARLNLRL